MNKILEETIGQENQVWPIKLRTVSRVRNYVLDTTALSYLVEDGNKRRANLLNWIEEIPVSSIYVPYSAAFEVTYGRTRIRGRRPEFAENLRQRFECLFRERLTMQSPSEQMLELHARMALEPALKHLWITDARAKNPAPKTILEIAATAITMNASIVTGRVRKFREINRFFPLPEIIDCHDEGCNQT